ncbi:MAG: hypothetical protein WBP10_02675 [Thermoanaerobaculia bacterium]
MPRWMTALCLLALVGVPLLAQQEERVTPVTATYSWTSDEGDYIGAGIPGSVSSAGGEFRLKRGLLQGVEVIYEQLTSNQKTLDFCPPRSPAQFLSPSTSYPDAVKCPPATGDDSTPGLDVGHDHRGCNMVTGDFTVGTMLYDYYGWPLRFSATFEQHCEDAVPALYGSVDAELGTIGPGSLSGPNLLVVMVNRLFEVTRAGDYVETYPILVDTDTNPTDIHDWKEDVRDVVVDSQGRVFIFNGTGTGIGPADEVRLTVFDSLKGTWEHYAGPTGWSVWEGNQSSPAFGALALFEDYVFASDTVRSGDEKGIVRFDMSSNFSAQRFADTESYIDLSLGLDGYLYALRLDFKTVDVFDPSTPGLDLVAGPITLDIPGTTTRIVSIAVDDNGDIFGVETFGDIHMFDPTTGTSLKELDVTTTFEVTDLDFDTDGSLIGASQAQRLLFADAALDTFSIVDLPDPSPSNIDMPGLDSVHVAVIPDLPSFVDGFESGDLSGWSSSTP